MNATECCRSIGCNCAGTRLAEQLAYPTWEMLIIACGVTVILLIAIELIMRKNQKDSSGYSTKQNRR